VAVAIDQVVVIRRNPPGRRRRRGRHPRAPGLLGRRLMLLGRLSRCGVECALAADAAGVGWGARAMGVGVHHRVVGGGFLGEEGVAEGVAGGDAEGGAVVVWCVDEVSPSVSESNREAASHLQPNPTTQSCTNKQNRIVHHQHKTQTPTQAPTHQHHQLTRSAASARPSP
jgi:hypothetical protein